MRPTVTIATFVFLLCSALRGSAPAAPVPVTACGQAIPAGAHGVLQNDLDCPDTGQALVVGSGASLALNGHTISVQGGGSVVDVHSAGRHTISGPGSFSNCTIACGVGFDYKRVVRVDSVDFANVAFSAIECLDQNAYRKNVVTARDVHISGDAAFGLTAGTVDLQNVSIAGTTIAAILSDRVKARGLSIVGTAGYGIKTDTFFSKRVQLEAAEIRDNQGSGVASHALLAVRSTVTGNGGTAGVDLLTQTKPKLHNTTCDRSRDSGTQTPWGICSGD